MASNLHHLFFLVYSRLRRSLLPVSVKRTPIIATLRCIRAQMVSFTVLFCSITRTLGIYCLLYHLMFGHSGDLYICGCGGSDHVSGDRLRPGGDCAEADLVLADARRVQAACASLRSMTSIVPDGTEPDVAQVSCSSPLIVASFKLIRYYSCSGVHAALHSGWPSGDGRCARHGGRLYLLWTQLLGHPLGAGLRPGHG